MLKLLWNMDTHYAMLLGGPYQASLACGPKHTPQLELSTVCKALPWFQWSVIP